MDVDFFAVQRARNVRCMIAANFMIMAYDWATSLNDEIELVWWSEWTFVKIVYLIVRYPTFIDQGFTIVYYFSEDLTQSQCLVFYRMALYLAAFGIAFTEFIPIWRTYALWNKSRAVVYGLLTMWAIWLLGNIYPITRFAVTVEMNSGSLPGIPGCTVTGGDQVVFISFATLLMIEIVVVGLTLVKGIRSLRQTKSAIVITLYRDGILFFVLITSFSLANVLVPIFAPFEYADPTNALARVMHTVLCCRVVLNLRSAARASKENATQLYAILPPPRPTHRAPPTVQRAVAEQRSMHSDTIELLDVIHIKMPDATMEV